MPAGTDDKKERGESVTRPCGAECEDWEEGARVTPYGREACDETMHAGNLRQFIDLQRPKTTINEAGRRVTEWVTIEESVPAQKKDVSGREFYQALAYHAEDTVTFTLRWRDDIDVTCRVVYNDRPYGILEINGLGEMYDYIQLKCREVNGQ